jgi:tetratricopeptide (TPR) repeat protein
VGAIREMTKNLSNFNEKFSKNTGNLGTALEKVNESYKLQTELIAAVNKIQERRTAATNLALLSKLIESSEQIGLLATYLNKTNDYLVNVQALNKKLDDYENRTQFIEYVSKFYLKHNNWLEENYDKANRALEEVVEKYNKTIEKVFTEMKTDIEGKRQELGTFIDNQNKALTASAGNLDEIVKALSELGEVQKAVKAFENSIKVQNDKIDRLANNLEKWAANMKSSGGAVQIQQKTPIWQIVLIGVIAISCSVLAVKSFIPNEPKAEKTEEVVQPQPTTQTSVVSDSTNSTAIVIQQ